jgi:uncharacterized protein YutE (UPF0331/DUF86 family)
MAPPTGDPENARDAFLAAMRAFAERLDIDIHNVDILVEAGTVTEQEGDELRARMAGERDRVNEIVEEFSRFR